MASSAVGSRSGAPKKPTQFYATVEDHYGAQSCLIGPFPSKEAVVAELQKQIEEEYVAGVDIDLEHLDQTTILIVEVVNEYKYDAVRAGVQLKERT